MQKKPFPLEILPEWHPTKNGNLKPDEVLHNQKIWWLGKCGHSYMMSTTNRITKNASCGVCSGSQLLAGFNDLATINPVLANEWHPTKNGTLKPSDVFATQGGIVWWQCKLGHEWEISPNGRIGRGCPYCSNRRILAGYNDLTTTHPLLAMEWHPTLNGELLPTQVSYGQGKTIYWLCPQGHNYPMSLNTRSRGVNCGICAGQLVLAGFNDLATTHPLLAAEWHPTLNGKLLPTQVSKGYDKKVFWLGGCNHEWPASPNARTAEKTNCPICANRTILVGFNDLATINPVLASEWHPTKNGELLPTQVFPKAKETVYWLGKCGHEWPAAIHSRAGGRGCSVCVNQKVLVGFNDLATINPVLASEWHPTKNGNLTPENFTAGSNQPIWWVCSKGHEWETQISWRNSGNGCKACAAANMVSQAEKDIFLYLNSLGFIVEQSNRNLLKGKELDLYLPKEKFAIEFNGIYWHTEDMGKDKTYHYNKWLECQKVEVKLIQIWEDDWKRDKELVLKTIAQKLDIKKQSLTDHTYAKITVKQTKYFMNANHIEGFETGDYYIGLFDLKKNLKAAMILNQRDNSTLSIIRYASTSFHGDNFTKLIHYIEEEYSAQKLVVVDDNCMSESNIYALNGFTLNRSIKPDYLKVIRNKRYPKDTKLISKTENRIWNAGQTSWIKTSTY